MKTFKLWLFHLKSKYTDNSFWDSLNGLSTNPISCIRITKGVAIYASNFNPETDTYLAY